MKPLFGNLLEYFERVNESPSHNQQQNEESVSENEFVSTIQFGGVPILPPVLTAKKREEIQNIRRQMLKVESRKRSKRRPELVARAQSIVEQIDSDGRRAHHSYEKYPEDASKREITEEKLYTDDQFVLKNHDSLPTNDRFSLEPSGLASNNVITPEEIADYGALLDSLGSDLNSLDDASLPTDFNGLPLTSVKQQQISHVLSRLSRVLNIHDTNSLMSTGGSSGDDPDTLTTKSSGMNPSFQSASGNHVTGSCDTGSNHNGSWNIGSSVTDSQDTVVEIPAAATYGSNVHDSSNSDVQFINNSSSTSLLSNDSQRSSNKSLRNTVHFSRLVTQINTRQSVEDNITFRQLKVTPTNSPRILGEPLSDDGDQNVISQINLNSESHPKNEYDSGSLSTRPRVQQFQSNKPVLGESLLSRVALTPDSLSPCLSPVDKIFQISNDVSSNQENKCLSNDESIQRNQEVHENAKFSQERISNNPKSCDNITNNMAVPNEQSDVRSPTLETSIGSNVKDSVNVITGENMLGVIDLGKSTCSTLASTASTVIEESIQRILALEHSITTIDDDTLREYRNALAATLESHSTMSPSNVSPDDRGKISVIPSDIHPARRGSYSLDEPSPVLLRSHAKTIQSGQIPDSTTEVVHHQVYKNNGDIKKTLDYEDNLEDDQAFVHTTVEKKESDNVENNKVIKRSLDFGEVEKLEADTEEQGYGEEEEEEDEMQSSKKDQLNKYLQDQCVHNTQLSPPDNKITSPVSLAESLKSTQVDLFSLQNNPGISIEEMMHIQAHKFEEIKQKIIEQQKLELEELFVKQRREQLLLQAEIEKQQVKIKGPSPVTSEDSPLLSHVSPQNIKLTNHSLLTTDSPNSTKPVRPVQHSPVKKSTGNRRTRIIIPQEAFDPAMKKYFDRVSATVKGYLVRRLIKTERVQELIKTIADTRDFAMNFQMETPIKRGKFTSSDSDLLDRIIAQLQSALFEVHDIFFVIPTISRMALIQHSRELAEKKRLNDQGNLSKSQSRLSTATLKAIERKKKAALENTLGTETLRPKSAPPSTSSPRSYRMKMDLRALKPLQGHVSPIRPDLEAARSHKRDHMRPIPEKKQDHVQNMKNKESSKTDKMAENRKTNKTNTNAKVKPKPKVNVGKAWR